LKEARQQLKRVRRADKRAKRLVQVIPALPLTPSQLQARNDRVDLWLLQWIRSEHEPESKDAERLERMIRDGYVVSHRKEPLTYNLTRRGLQHLRELRERVDRGPGTT
jgi:hypothetical protein